MVVSAVVLILVSLDSLYYYVLMVQIANHFPSNLHLMSFGFHLVRPHLIHKLHLYLFLYL